MSYRIITVTATLVATIVSGCGGVSPGQALPSQAGAPSPVAQESAAPSALTARPPIVDVPFYKGDTARSGVHPGPAPTTKPVEVWRTEIGCALGNRTGVIGAGLLITGCDAATVVALDASTGQLRWTASVDGQSLGSPAIAAGAVYVADSAGAFTSLDLASGKVRWTVPIPAIRHPVVVDDTVYLGTSDGRFLGLATSDGSTSWSWQAPEGVKEAAGTVVDDAAYIGTDDGKLRVIGLADRAERWSYQVISGGVSTPAITADTVFVASLQTGEEPIGELYALDRVTGKDRWRYRTISGNQVAPPTVAGDAVISPSSADGLFAFDAARGTVRWQAPTGPMGGQTPAIVGDTVVLAMDRSVAAFNGSDGAKLWEYDVKADLDNSPIVSGGMVFVGDNAGVIRALAEPALAALFPKASTVPDPEETASPVAVLELAATFDASTSELDQPSGMDVGPDGNLYVTNALKSEVLVLDPASGDIIRRWGGKGRMPGEFDFLRDVTDPYSAVGGIAVSDDGSVYVLEPANRRVQQFDANGTFVRQWGRFGSANGQFLDPLDIALGPGGDLFVIDGQREDIQRFTADGVHVATIGEGAAPGFGITVTQDGTLINADWDNHRVQAWDTSGTFLWTLGSRGTKAGDFEHPADVVVDESGRLHIVDKTRVQTLTPDGQPIGSWPAPTDAFALAYGNGMLFLSAQFENKILKIQLLD